MELLVFPVRPTETVADLFCYAVNTFADSPAFCTEQKTISYRQVAADVSCAVQYLWQEDAACCRIRERDPYLFAVGFFAAMLLGLETELDAPGDPREEWVSTALEAFRPAPLPPLSAVDPNRPAVVIFSSGTTAGRKEVVLSQRNLAVNTVCGLERLCYQAGKRFLHLVPFSHVFGLVCELLAAFYSGCTVCFGGSPLSFFRDLQMFRPQYLNLPPSVVVPLLRMLEQAGKAAVGGALERILCGGAHLPAETVERMAQQGVCVLTCYGMSEAPGVCLNAEWGNRPHTTGRPIRCDELCISETGEILISGDNVMLRYRNRDQQPFVERDGKRWLRTGDAGALDEDGFLAVFGRMDHLMVFSDGKKIAPEQMEAVINELAGVRLCRVSLQRGTETVVAEIVPEEAADREDLCRHIRAVEVEGHYSCEVRFVADIPKTATGKVKRYAE